jgi:Spy/CpxP family protein refolding chaperone
MKKKLVAASVLAGVALTLGSLNAANAHDGRGERGKLGTVLGGLVAKGTLTQAQLDEIKKALDEGRNAMKAAHDAEHAARTKVITDTLGITEAELKTRIQAGDSLATIAGTKKAALISALVAYETKKIDEAVTAGKLTAAQAATLKTGLTDRITKMVENVKGPKGSHMDGHKGGKGHGKGHHKGFRS